MELSPKKAAYKWVSENLLPLEILKDEEVIDTGNFSVRPFPPEVAKRWLPFARILLAPRTTPILTPFGKRVSENEAFSFAKKTIQAIPDEALVQMELASLKDWEDDKKNGIPRAHFDPTMWMARLVACDPTYHPPEVSPNFKRHLPKSYPLGIRQVKIQNPRANIGFWDLKRWNDQRRSDSANEEFHIKVFMDATRWEMKMSNKSRITPGSVVADTPPCAGFSRSQSGGRVIVAPPYEVSLHARRFLQAIQKMIESAREVWYAVGDRLARYTQMHAVLDGQIGERCVDGDDFIVMSGDGCVAGDSSGFDTGVTTRELLAWLNVFKSSVPGSLWSLYLATFYATYEVELAGNIGMFKQKVRWGIRSGGAETHLADSVIQDNRIGSSDWSTLESGLSDINQRGVYRPEKQFCFKEATTLAQLMVTKTNLGTGVSKPIFGFVSRMARNIREMESWTTQEDFLPVDLDARVLAQCANLYGSPTWKPFVEWVRDRWSIRSSRQELLDRATSLLSKGRVEVASGFYERDALWQTLKLLLG